MDTLRLFRIGSLLSLFRIPYSVIPNLGKDPKSHQEVTEKTILTRNSKDTSKLPYRGHPGYTRGKRVA